MAGVRQQIEGNLGEHVFPIQGAFTIGRDSHSDLVLVDQVVSGRHATIEDNSGECTLVDHQSRNGTYVQRAGSEPIRVTSRLRLQTADVIRIGSTRLVFDASISARTAHGAPSSAPPNVNPADATSAFPRTEHGRVIPVFMGERAARPEADPLLARLEALEDRVAKLEAELTRREQAER